MDCMKSFSLTTTDINTYTVASGAMSVWGAINNWQIYGTEASTFLIRGFKNINIFGIDMTGNVSSNYGIAPRTDNANPFDFEVNVRLNGQIPTPIGVVGTPNDWPLITNNNFIQQQFTLTKYKPSIKFATPIQSVTQIDFFDFKAYGEHAQNALQIKMGYYLQFTFYYTFEGE